MQFILTGLTRRLRVAALVFAGLMLCACVLATEGNPVVDAVSAAPATEPAPVTAAPVSAAASTPAVPVVAAEAVPQAATAPTAAPPVAASSVVVDDNGYRLGAGDRISISVLGERDLSLELVVDDQGDINYPFLGEMSLIGLTVNDVRDDIIEGLQPEYLLDPRVTVQVIEYRKFFVNGEVQKPGGFPWQSGMTVRKAVALAGGFTQRAARSRLVIIREADVAKRPVPVEIDASVAPGDIITIDQSFF